MALLPLNFDPIAAIEGRKERIACDLSIDFRQIHLRCAVQRLRIDITTADHKRHGIRRTRGKRFLQSMDDRAARRHERCRSRDDDIGAIRQAPPDRFEGLASHDHAMTGGELAKSLEILGQVPGHFVARADGAITGQGGDDRDDRWVHWESGKVNGDECNGL